MEAECRKCFWKVYVGEGTVRAKAREGCRIERGSVLFFVFNGRQTNRQRKQKIYKHSNTHGSLEYDKGGI